MSNTKKILITLTPLDKFYFGSEMGFARKDKDFDENFSSYVVKSNCFPQQSSLMGMFRYFLLLSNKNIFDGKKIIDKVAAKELIGEKSFCISNNYDEIDFKKIKSIGLCFIQYKTNELENWDNLITAPFDYDYEVSFENCNTLRKTQKNRIPIVNGYNAKDGISTKYISDTLCIPKDELFCPDPRIGIDRDFYGNTKDGAYYKQTFYRFWGKNVRFAFHAEIDEDLKLPKKMQINLGGDNSMFNLSIEEPVKVGYSSNVTKVAPGISKVILLSDAFIQPEELDKCLYCINEIVSFRFLSTTIEVKNYTKFKDDELKRSEKYNLHQKGSVYFFDNEESKIEFTTALENKKCFRQIGYNQYISFKN